jgi:hypothetical protein
VGQWASGVCGANGSRGEAIAVRPSVHGASSTVPGNGFSNLPGGVFRGGAFTGGASDGTFAVNAFDDPSDSADGIGFRCARLGSGDAHAPDVNVDHRDVDQDRDDGDHLDHDVDDHGDGQHQHHDDVPATTSSRPREPPSSVERRDEVDRGHVLAPDGDAKLARVGPAPWW